MLTFIIWILESLSEGKISTIALEYLCIAIEQLGVNFSLSKMLNTLTYILLPPVLPISAKITSDSYYFFLLKTLSLDRTSISICKFTMVYIDHFNKLSNYQWHGLNSFDLFSGTNKFFFESSLFFSNEVFLDFQHFDISL
jgi:hypothetical protein